KRKTETQDKMTRDPHKSQSQALPRPPDLARPDELWPRLRAGQRHAVRRRRVLHGASASALALLLVAVVPWPGLHVPVDAPQGVAATDGELIRDQIVTIDRALQVAYARGASDAEVEPMWQARNVLATRIATRADAARKGI